MSLFNMFKKDHLTQEEKKLLERVPFHSETEEAVIRCSICTGEQAAGFKNKQTGHFTEVMVLHSEEDLERFKRIYQLSEVKKEY